MFSLSNQINDNDSEHYDINIYSNDAELMVSVGKGIQAGMMSWEVESSQQWQQRWEKAEISWSWQWGVALSGSVATLTHWTWKIAEDF